MSDVVIVGAGPAGMAAAEVLADAGLRPVLVWDTPWPGGQGTRRLNPALDLDPARLFAGEAAEHARQHARYDRILARVEARPGTLAWAACDGVLHTLSAGRTGTLPYAALILATGASDRIMPVPGWTLPGVFSLGAAQVALKDQGCFIGARVVLAGSSPLLPLAALQYRRMGARDITVLDTTPLSAKAAAAPGLRHAPGVAAKGLSYLAALWRQGVAVHHGVRLLRIEGAGHVAAIRFADRRGRGHRLDCDAVALGHGLRPETQLAELAGAEFAFDPAFRQWYPRSDADGRAAPGLYLAGDGSIPGGAAAAEACGALAAAALLEDRGLPAPPKAPLRRRARALHRFQRTLARAFRWPWETAADLPGETVVCRCENVTAAEIRAAATAPLAPAEVNRIKALTRCGMGRCQGRFCGPALAEIAAAAAGVPVEQAGRLRAQAPVKPVPFAAIAPGAEP